MLFCEFGARSIYAHCMLFGWKHTERARHRENHKNKTKATRNKRNCQRNNMFDVFKMIYTVVYVESKDQRFVCTSGHSVSVCYVCSNMRKLIIQTENTIYIWKCLVEDQRFILNIFNEINCDEYSFCIWLDFPFDLSIEKTIFTTERYVERWDKPNNCIFWSILIYFVLRTLQKYSPWK